LALTIDNVSIILDEVRPYLISDGGNVAVDRVEDDGSVYLQLQGACGSCPSSTVTMKMGIERVLKEQVWDPPLKQVLQIEPEVDEESLDAIVEQEMNRLRPAMSAMGAVMELRSVDESTGVIKVLFRGSTKVQQGLELALLDAPKVNKVTFVME
jgi:Fe-S cluster biogenesis protein NfuA